MSKIHSQVVLTIPTPKLSHSTHPIELRWTHQWLFTDGIQHLLFAAVLALTMAWWAPRPDQAGVGLFFEIFKDSCFGFWVLSKVTPFVNWFECVFTFFWGLPLGRCRSPFLAEYNRGENAGGNTLAPLKKFDLFFVYASLSWFVLLNENDIGEF